MVGRTRYVVVGLGARSEMFTKAISGKHSGSAELVGMCDVNRGRMAFTVKRFFANGPTIATYGAEGFEQMIAEQKPAVVIVTTKDATHDHYICRAMELGCDVVTEKPMTTDEVKCRRILETAKRTGRKLQVTFNYRYSPVRTQVKEMISGGEIGEVLSVDFGWLLDTKHGADYFRRWHRRRENSGSLLVHKSTHHFDLVNWWLGDTPEEVFAHASRRYYVEATAQRLGLGGHGERCMDCRVKGKCPFALDLAGKELLKGLYLDCEEEDGYLRDRCVFAKEIDIWDTMSVTVRYTRGALLNYMLTAYSPYEGYRVGFGGTKGRLEHLACEDTYVSGDGTVPGELQRHNTTLTVVPEFSQPRPVEVRTGIGGHGGGDQLLLQDVFAPSGAADPLGRRAGARDGAYSILVGVAACRSIDTGKAVKIADLLGDAPI